MTPKVSVIVPVYKAEAFLHRCIDSILSQNFEEFELILVDDGSPDKSGEICDEYAEMDNRICVIHQNNCGVTMARAKGVKCASETEYITFVDADDFLPPTAIYDLYFCANSDYDIIVGNYDRNYRIYFDNVVEPDTYSKLLLSGKLHSGPVARLYRRKLFQNEEIFNISREVLVGEDLIMNLHLSIINCKKVKIIPKVVYNYYNNSSSVMNTFVYTSSYLGKLYELEKKLIFASNKHEFITNCIEGILNYKNIIIEHYLFNNEWKKTDFHKKLLVDIKEYKYKLSLYLRLSLSFSNPVYSLIHRFVRSLCNILRNI